MTGELIVVEGTDGSGSTSQAKALVEWLNDGGVSAVFTCEPSGGLIGRMIREVLTGRIPDPLGWDTLALLFAADRLDHLKQEVEPAIARGQVVVSDRYVLSSLIYQALSSKEDQPLDWLRAINSRARPADLTLVLNVSADTAHARRAARGGAEELFEVPALQRALAKEYADPGRHLLGQAWQLVNAEPGFSEVQQALRDSVREHLALP